MLKTVEKDENYLVIEASDMITRDDIVGVIPTIEDIIKKYEKVKNLIVLKNVKGYTFEGFLADFNFYLNHKDNFEYVAMVGDETYKKEMENIIEGLMPEKGKFFETSELDKAKEWLKAA